MDPLGTPTDQGPVDLNTASVGQLAALEGIDDLLAERIVAYRATTGLFGSVDQLARVPGIDAAQVDDLRPYLTVSDSDEVGGLGTAFVPLEADSETPDVLEMEEPQIPADDEDALDEELRAYEEMEVPEEELPPEDWPDDPPDDPYVGEEDRSDDDAPDGTPLVVTDMAEGEEEPPGEDTPLVEEAPRWQDPPPFPNLTSTPVAVEAAVADDAAIAENRRVERRTETRAETRAEPVDRARGGGLGRALLHVLLGGILGMLLTLFLFMLFPGILSYASQNLVTALSRNMNTMQANQELTWERVNQLDARAAELESRLAEMNDLAGQVAELEEQAAVSAEQLGDLDDRVETNAAELESQSAQLAELEEGFEGVQERVSVFDTFFQALSELLLQMDPVPASGEDLGS